MDVQNSACITFFIPDGIRAMRNYQISPFQKIKTAEIHSELALCFGDDAYILASVHHWVHEFKIGRVSIGDDPRPRKPPLDELILQF
jgi:predicted restriction endonuclease